MQSSASRVGLIVLGATLISIVLGATAINREALAALAPTTEAPHVAVLISLTPSDTPSPTLTPSNTATITPTLGPSVSPTLTLTPSPSPTLTPWPTPDGQALRREVKAPIFMYHHVGPLPAEPDEMRVGLTVLPDRFEEQLKFLKDHGYQSIDFYQLYYAITLGWELPPKPAIFTFDDAYKDIYTFAFPLMKKYGFTGTVFVPTQFADEGRADYMNWAELEEMAAAGWRLEPHTKTHESVANRNRDWLIYQMLGSMETLKFHIGYQPRFFAYPYGAYDEDAIEILKEAGFWGAVTTDSSWYHNLKEAYIWGRVRVAGQFVIRDFASVLNEPYP
jgi:peptidoglycan/xylan/chitin deacetylase (PgdA/CDA1 family)